jgi:Ino eighty subunit 2
VDEWEQQVSSVAGRTRIARAKGRREYKHLSSSNRACMPPLDEPIAPLPSHLHLCHLPATTPVHKRPRQTPSQSSVCPPLLADPPVPALHHANMPRLRARPPPAPLTAPSAAQTASSTRPRRGTANQSPAAAIIQRSSPEETRQSIHLTVKSSPGKLRQATGGAVPKTTVSRQNIVAGKRASRSSRIVREVDSEDEDDDDEEAEEADAMDVDDDEDDEDAEGDEDEDMDADGDEDDDMESGSPASRIVVSAKQSVPVNPVINITKAQDSVEAKEMAMDDDDDDDELSDPDSDLDEEDAEGEDEDAEGEEDDDMVGQNGDPDEEMDSDEDFSRGQTPADVTKMTKRQRALMEEGEDGALMALSNEAQKKKHLTAEENAMRRAEMARRRKNLSEKRNEEEKVCSIHASSRHLLIKLRWTPSIASSRSNLLSEANALLKSLEKATKMAIPRGQIHSSSDTCKMPRALNSGFQTSGWMLLQASSLLETWHRRIQSPSLGAWLRKWHRCCMEMCMKRCI